MAGEKGPGRDGMGLSREPSWGFPYLNLSLYIYVLIYSRIHMLQVLEVALFNLVTHGLWFWSVYYGFDSKVLSGEALI